MGKVAAVGLPPEKCPATTPLGHRGSQNLPRPSCVSSNSARVRGKRREKGAPAAAAAPECTRGIDFNNNRNKDTTHGLLSYAHYEERRLPIET